MKKAEASLPEQERPRLLATTAGLLALSILLGAGFNALRPASTRLSWTEDWERHIETLAFRAGIPVTFLMGARERVNDPATVVFDARIPDEYQAGHLPRALSLPVGDVDQAILPHVHRLMPQTPILLYCGGADCEDALDLALKLREFGFGNLTVYTGGYAEWMEYGGTVETGDAT
jgi:rhodanese-related sulfurtransferase